VHVAEAVRATNHTREKVMRKILASIAVLLLTLGVVVGDEFGGKITKIDGNKITIEKRAKKGQKGDEVTLTAGEKLKVVKSKYNRETKKLEVGEALEGGLKNEAIKEGATVRVVTDGDKISEIQVIAGGKRKKKNS